MADDAKKLEDSQKSATDLLKKLAASTQKTDGAFNEMVDKGVNLATAGLRKLSEVVGNNTEKLEQFTNIGSSFGNSLNAMKIAAAESRVSLEDFYDILEKNNKSFAGLGGTVAEGSKEFAKLSRSFYDSGFAENLKQMGYTGKELNEVLALQVGISKSNMESTEEGRTRSLKSAAELAYQMDEISKLTGKSRKEQAEAMKEQQRDMKLEAALRQQTAGMSKEDADAYRKQVMAHISEVQNTMGPAAANAAKEIATSGTLQTQASRQFVATAGEGAQALIRSTQAIKDRDFAEADRERKRAQAEIVAIQDTPAYQNLIIFGTKVSGVVGDTMAATQTMYDGVKNQLQATGTAVVNLGDKAGEVAGALGNMRESVRKEQEARDPLTSLMVRTADRLKDAEAAYEARIRSTMMDPSKGLGQALAQASDARSMGIAPKTTAGDIAEERQKALAARQAGQEVTVGMREAYDRVAKPIADNFIKPASELLGQGVKAVDRGFTAAGSFAERWVKEMSDLQKQYGGSASPENAQTKRDSGTIGLTGMLFEPKDIITKVQKGESVMTESQIKGLMRGSQTEGMEKLLREMSTGAKQPSSGVNLEKIAKDIVTTTSKVEITNWPKNFGKVEIKQEDKPAAQTQAGAAAKPAQSTENKTQATLTTPKEEKPKTTQTSTTKLTVNGQDVDPNSKEGQAAMKQLDESAKKTEEAIKQLTNSFGAGGTSVTLEPKSIENMAKPLGENLKNVAQEIKEAAPTTKDVKDIRSSETLKTVTEDVKDTGTTYKEVKGPSMTNKSSAQFLLDNQISQASSSMRGSSVVDKGALDEALSLSEKERLAKKQKYQEEYDLAQKEVSDRDKRLIEIEKRYEDEGRAADAKNDEEYKRLAAEEKIFLEQRGNAQKNLQALKEVDDIKRKVEDQGYDFEKENATRLQNLSKESAEAVQKEMKEAIPVKELQGSLAKASESLDDHGKKTLQLVMNDSDEMLETRKRNAKNIIKSEEADIAERQSRIKELENKAAESELSSREKKWLDEEKAEIAKAEERKKLQESDLRAIELAEKARQGVLEESNKVTKQAYDAMADDVAEISKVLPESTGKAFSDMTMEADEMSAEMANTFASSDVLDSLTNLKSGVVEQFDSMSDDVAEMTKVLPETSTRALSDMTMEADEIAAEMANTFASTDILDSLTNLKSDVENQFDSMSDDVAELTKVLPETSTRALSDMTMEADEMAAELSNTIASVDMLEGPKSNFQPVEVDQLANKDKVDGSYKKTEGFKMPSIAEISFGAGGSPLVSRQAQKSLESKKDTSQDDAETKKLKRQQEQTQAKSSESDKKDNPKQEARSSTKTLDDVVKSLDTLNTSVNKLTSKVEESSKNQVAATKSALSGNLYNK